MNLLVIFKMVFSTRQGERTKMEKGASISRLREDFLGGNMGDTEYVTPPFVVIPKLVLSTALREALSVFSSVALDAFQPAIYTTGEVTTVFNKNGVNIRCFDVGEGVRAAFFSTSRVVNFKSIRSIWPKDCEVFLAICEQQKGPMIVREENKYCFQFCLINHGDNAPISSGSILRVKGNTLLFWEK